MRWSTPSRIEVLGTVQAWRDGREVPLGAPQQCSVLTLLAVADGQPVPTQEIVEAIWEARAPRTAANVVQTYVKRLRRILEPDRPPRSPSQMLPAVNSGYALRADVATVDLWQFRHLVRLAGSARREGDNPRLLDLLTRALTLWKGQPGGDLPALSQHPRLRAAAEEYGNVANWYAQASLVTGAATEALPMLTRAAAARPFDEPLHAHLIRLYHAAGQRSDAVNLYRDIRVRLRDELGLDPGTELTRAYQELLSNERPGAGRTVGARSVAQRPSGSGTACGNLKSPDGSYCALTCRSRGRFTP